MFMETPARSLLPEVPAFQDARYSVSLDVAAIPLVVDELTFPICGFSSLEVGKSFMMSGNPWLQFHVMNGAIT